MLWRAEFKREDIGVSEFEVSTDFQVKALGGYELGIKAGNEVGGVIAQAGMDGRGLDDGAARAGEPVKALALR